VADVIARPATPAATIQLLAILMRELLVCIG
jgi:hypothetical protein